MIQENDLQATCRLFYILVPYIMVWYVILFHSRTGLLPGVISLSNITECMEKNRLLLFELLVQCVVHFPHPLWEKIIEISCISYSCCQCFEDCQALKLSHSRAVGLAFRTSWQGDFIVLSFNFLLDFTLPINNRKQHIISMHLKFIWTVILDCWTLL